MADPTTPPTTPPSTDPTAPPTTEPRGLDPVMALVRRSSLEDVFLRLTGRTLVD